MKDSVQPKRVQKMSIPEKIEDIYRILKSGSSGLPDMSGHNGQFLTNNGTAPSWTVIEDAGFPPQSGNEGKFLSTDGTTVLWDTPLNGTLPGDSNTDLNNNVLTFTNGVTSFKNKDTVGEIFNYSWASNPLTDWVDNTPTATVATDGVSTIVTGGTYDTTNYFVHQRYIGTENYEITFTTQVIAKDSNSRGLMFSIPIIGGMGSGIGFTFLQGATEGWIEFSLGATLPDGSVSSQDDGQLIWSIGDVIDYSIRKDQRTFNVSMKNRSNGSESRLVVDSGPQVGYPHIYFLGDIKLIGTFSIVYNEIQSPEIALVGDSIAWGGQSDSYGSKYFSLLLNNLKVYGSLNAAPAEGGLEGIARIDDILTIRPSLVLYAYGVNAFGNSTPVNTFKTQMQSFIDPLVAAGINVKFINLVPQASGNVAPYNVAIQQIATANGLEVIDINSVLKKSAGTDIQDIYVYDGIHPNTAGHAQIASVLYNALKDDFVPNPTIKLLVPFSSDLSLPVVRLDHDSNLVATPYVADTKLYITNNHLDQNNVQPNSTINISGSIYALGNLLIGGSGGNYTSPYFSVNDPQHNDGYTRSVLFLSQNFQTIAGGVSQFDTGKVQFTGGAYLLGFQAPLIIKSGFTGSSTGTLTLDNNTENTTLATYKILSMKVDGTEKAYVNMSGAISLAKMTKAARNLLAPGSDPWAIFQTDNTPGLRVYNGTHWVRYTETNDD